jgi:hypothetical protein
MTQTTYTSADGVIEARYLTPARFHRKKAKSLSEKSFFGKLDSFSFVQGSQEGSWFGGAGGRNAGGFCRRFEATPYGFAVEIELARNALKGPALRHQLLYIVLFVDLKDIRHSAGGYALHRAFRRDLLAP